MARSKPIGDMAISPGQLILLLNAILPVKEVTEDDRFGPMMYQAGIQHAKKMIHQRLKRIEEDSPKSLDKYISDILIS